MNNIQRDSPPPPSRELPDTGVLIKGWKIADKMFRTQQELISRINNKKRVKQTNDGESKDGGPLKKRKVNSGEDVQTSQLITKSDVDHWFRNSQKAIQSQTAQVKDREFQNNLDQKRKQYASKIKQETKKKKQAEKKKASEMKQELKKMKQAEQKKKKEDKRKAAEEKKQAKQKRKGNKSKAATIASNNEPSTKSSLPMSPLRRKRKKMTPIKRNQQQNPNSVILGEDPEVSSIAIDHISMNSLLHYSRRITGIIFVTLLQLDDMIENIVLEFMHESEGSGLGLEFDGGAVSALKEAAKESLNVMTHKGKQPELEANEQNASSESGEAKISATSKPIETAAKSDEDDERITNMIEQLIQESGVSFDGRARDALREVATEIVKGDSSLG